MTESSGEDGDIVASYEELFKQRYTDEDADYKAAGFTPPPVIYPWGNESNRRYRSPRRSDFRRDVKKRRGDSPPRVEQEKRRRTEERQSRNNHDRSPACSSAA